MTTSRTTGLPARRERGVTLVIALIFMVALTLLGVGMIRATTSEERMGANTRDYDLAFAAAEAALRDAEIRIAGTYLSPRTPVEPTNYPTQGTCGTATPAAGSTAQASQIGICFTNVGNTPLVEPFSTTYLLDNTTYAATLGQFTGTAAVQGVGTQPHYYMEAVSIYVPPIGMTNAYRITAKGYGVRSTTQVILQEIYLP